MEYDREFLTSSMTLLLLSLLCERPMYGYEIIRESKRRSKNEFVMKEGTVYPALHKLERDGLLKSEWRNSETGKRRKYYIATARGRRTARSKRTQWESLSAALRAIWSQA